ncbi:putative ribokinase [Collariella sp. IMI 366227]|nr:putative ribokinase [Collariella sp. IMI 366227]
MDLVAYVPHHPLPGETLTADAFATSPGGKGANQAVACAKLSGARPHLDGSATGGVPWSIWWAGDFAGNNLKKLEVGSKGEGKLPDMLIMQLEIPFETVLAVLGAARRRGGCVVESGAGEEVAGGAYKGLAHLVVNETEAAILGEVEESVLDTEEGIERVARGRGVYYMTKTGEKGLVPAEKATVVDTTAAGDTFVGRYALDAVGRREGEFDIAAAVRKANKAAAKTVERAGAQDSIPWRDELEI